MLLQSCWPQTHSKSPSTDPMQLKKQCISCQATWKPQVPSSPLAVTNRALIWGVPADIRIPLPGGIKQIMLHHARADMRSFTLGPCPELWGHILDPSAISGAELI